MDPEVKTTLEAIVEQLDRVENALEALLGDLLKAEDEMDIQRAIGNAKNVLEGKA